MQAENAAASATGAGSDTQRTAIIAKPRGSAGDGYCLIEKMGLSNDKLSYNAIVVRSFIRVHFIVTCQQFL